ncbi:MAG TPA: hypothetical protein VMM76_13280 [Pirellulaceae bacterium]|nr:hypothetical protein [Pirellulaceae bacterium]
MGSLPALLFVASITIAQNASSPQPTIAPEAIAVAVRQLGADDFEVRQRATAFLWQAGRVTERALQLATLSDDPEIRFRAGSILEDFRYGIFADTSEDVASLVRRYRREESKNRDPLWERILQQASIETLVAITTQEPISARRRQVLERLEREGTIEYAVTLAEKWRGDFSSPEDVSGLDEFVRRQLPHFLAKQQFDKSESLLEQSATDGPGIRNWAAYLFLRGQLDAKIQELQRQAARDAIGVDELAQTQTKLVHMLRVKGDEAEALAIARQLSATDDSLLRGLLFDQRAWSELALRQRAVLAANPSSLEALGFAAAYNRLVGNKEEFAKHISTIRERAEKLFGGDSLEHCREALFLNGFTDEAIQLLTREFPVEAFSVQIMRGQYADAFEAAGIGTTRQSRDAWLRGVVEKPDRSKNWHNNFRIAVQLAQILATVGEKHESSEMFEQLANSIKSHSEGVQLRQLAEFELRAKMVEEAFEHAAQAFDKDRNATSITLLFVNHSTAAKTWWDIYAALEPNDTTRQRLARVRSLFYQRKNRDEAIAQISETQARVRALVPKHTSRTKWLHSIGEAYALHQATEQARQCYESIAQEHGPSAIRLADMLAKQEEWIAASNWYHSAWQQDRQPYALYLYGEMLSKAGAEEAGNESKQLARLIPLAGASRYEGLASHLAQRGLAEVAEQECELLRRCSTWSELQMFHALASLGQAVGADDPLRAAAYSEQRMLNCLQELWHFIDQGSYVRIPLEVHRDRAKGMLKQHQFGGAIDELRMCQQIWPADLNIPEAFVPQLDEVGQTDAAGELFSRAYELIDETCNLFPNSALHHNNAAWLAAKCKRRLDDALAHAKRAIELVPNEAQYIDTLGEVYFQQGQVDLAINCAKQCIDLAPSTAFYQEQLTRFQAAQQQPE